MGKRNKFMPNRRSTEKLRARAATLPGAMRHARAREFKCAKREVVVGNRERLAPKVNIDLLMLASDAVGTVNLATRLAAHSITNDHVARNGEALQDAKKSTRCATPLLPNILRNSCSVTEIEHPYT